MIVIFLASIPSAIHEKLVTQYYKKVQLTFEIIYNDLHSAYTLLK